jgi:hypothetical protein
MNSKVILHEEPKQTQNETRKKTRSSGRRFQYVVPHFAQCCSLRGGAIRSSDVQSVDAYAPQLNDVNKWNSCQVRGGGIGAYLCPAGITEIRSPETTSGYPGRAL